jgi:hypothetical protein
MLGYNKIITTVNSISPEHQFIPNPNNNIVIDTSENRLGINTITPEASIDVNNGTVKTKDLIVLGDLSANIVSCELLPKSNVLYSLGDIDHGWKDLFVGAGTIYMNNTPIIRMGDYTRHGHNDISALIIENFIDNLERPLDILGRLNITSDVSINESITMTGGLVVMADIVSANDFVFSDEKNNASPSYNKVNIVGDLTIATDVSFMNKLALYNDISFNKGIDISGSLNITEITNPTGTSIITTKLYTKKPVGGMHTKFVIDPASDGLNSNGEVVIVGNLDIKGTASYINFANVDISDNIVRMNANHDIAVSDGGISVTNSSNIDKLFSYNNAGDTWKTHSTNINLGPDGGVVSSEFMNIGTINIYGNTIDVASGDLQLSSDSANGKVQLSSSHETYINATEKTIIHSQEGNVVVGNVSINSNTISSIGSDLNLSADSSNISTDNCNLNLGTGSLSVDGVSLAHMPSGGITLWYGNSSNVPIGWTICNGTNGTPNLLGRFVVCSGDNTETTYTENSSGGNDSYTLDISHIPSHNHVASSQLTDIQHNHASTAEFTQVIHNHGATSQNTDVLHNHGATSQNTDVSHNHTATSQNTDISHTHIANLLLLQDDTLNHTHLAVTNQVTSTHTHNTNNQIDLVSRTGYHDESHTHEVVLDDISHNHTMDVSTLGNNHQHSIAVSNAEHGHGLDFEVAYSNAGGGTGTDSLLLDNQTQGTMQASQLGGGLEGGVFVGGVQTATALHDHNTQDSSGTDHSHTLAQTSHTHQAVMGTSSDTSHNHTTQVSEGGEPHYHSLTTIGSSILHNHVVLPTSQANIDHNHLIQTDHTNINHDHIIEIEETSINHKHSIQITPTSIDHDHVIETAQTSINHNHVIETTYTGSGSSVDNRPKWLGLWYIMKL